MRTFAADHEIKHVFVELGNGSLDVHAAEDGAVAGEIHAADHDLEQRLTVDTFGSELRIVTPKQEKRWFAREVKVTIRVPAGTDLTLTTGSGDLTTDVRLGRVVAKSGSGDLRLAGASTARLNTGSGDVTALSIDGEADLISGSGDIRVDRCSSDLTVKTASGDVTIGRLDGPVEAKLASGDFRLAATTGSVNARTASGDIAIGIADELPAWLNLKSGSGDVNIALPPTGEPEPGSPFVSIYARTGSGDIRINRA